MDFLQNVQSTCQKLEDQKSSLDHKTLEHLTPSSKKKYLNMTDLEMMPDLSSTGKRDAKIIGVNRNFKIK